MLRLTVLGSCGTYPAPGRACSGYLIEATPPPDAPPGDDGDAGRPVRVWVDTGSGSLANLLRYTTLEDLDAIWVSHLHADHCTDLPVAYYTLRYGVGRRAQPLPVYGPAGWGEHMGRFLNVDGEPDDDPRSMDDEFAVRELTDGEVIHLRGLTLTAVATVHSVETFGLRATSGDAAIGYSADSGPCEALGRLADHADLFVCEAAWLEAPEAASPIHCTAEDAGVWAARAAAARLVLTHVRPHTDPAAATARASRRFGGPVGVALEGDSYEFGART